MTPARRNLFLGAALLAVLGVVAGSFGLLRSQAGAPEADSGSANSKLADDAAPPALPSPSADPALSAARPLVVDEPAPAELPARAEPRAQQAAQSIRVVVVDAAARTVPEARLQVWRKTNTPPPGNAGAETGIELVADSATDALGRGLVQLETREQFLVAVKDGVGRSARLSDSQLKRAVNADGEAVVTLETEVVVDGLVLRADGSPALGVAVEVEPVRTFMGDRFVTHGATSMSDGRFRLALAASPRIQIAAIAEDGARVEQQLEVPENRQVSVTLHLPGEWWITGVVLAADGSPQPRAAIRIFHGRDLLDPWTDVSPLRASPEAVTVNAAPDGSFRHRALALEPHVLVALLATSPPSDPALVQLEPARPTATLSLQLPEPAVIAGRVRTPDGAALAGASVALGIVAPPVLAVVHPRLPFHSQAPGLVVAETRTDGEGRFQFDQLQPRGIFDLLVTPPGGGPKAPAEVMLEHVPAGSTDLDVVARFIEPARTGAIHVFAREAATGLPVELSVVGIAPEGEVNGAIMGTDSADGGRARFQDLVPDRAYTVVVTSKGLSSVDVHDVIASTTPARLEVELPALGALEVQVLDAHGVPLPYVKVQVKRSYQGAGFRSAKPAATDRDGRAHFTPLDAGSFRVSFTVDGVTTEAAAQVGPGESAFVRVTAQS